jgi:hypothetical protein
MTFYGQPSSVCTIKTGTFTGGTINKTIDINSVHSTTDFLWQAADDDDKIVVAANGIFGIIVNPAQMSLQSVIAILHRFL